MKKPLAFIVCLIMGNIALYGVNKKENNTTPNNNRDSTNQSSNNYLQIDSSEYSVLQFIYMASTVSEVSGNSSDNVYGEADLDSVEKKLPDNAHVEHSNHYITNIWTTSSGKSGDTTKQDLECPYCSYIANDTLNLKDHISIIHNKEQSD